jgi:hypothetical protein
MLPAARRSVLRLRDEGVIGDAVLHALQLDFDLEASVLEHDARHDPRGPGPSPES